MCRIAHPFLLSKHFFCTLAFLNFEAGLFMKQVMKMFPVVLTLLGLLSSCVSVEKYNLRRTRPISVKKLQRDIDYVQKNLYSRHPDYDYYTPKPVLDARFDSLRKAVNHPMTANEFYISISPVIAQVHQGHMATLPAPMKVSRERKKYLKTMGTSPLQQFDYKWEEHRLFVIRNRSTDSAIQKGWELVAINKLSVQDIYTKYAHTFSSDGYNQTALPGFFARRIPTFYNEELGQQDSLSYTFKTKEGELVIKEIKRAQKTPAVKSALADSTKKQLVKKDSVVSDTTALAKKEQEKLKQQKNKEEHSNKVLYGYDATKKEYIRNLKFYGKDSTLAYLKVAQFSEGKYKKAYARMFDSIQKAKAEVLVLDLRDNPGGRAMEVTELYRYFADSSFKMYAPSKVSSKSSLLNAGFYSKMPKAIWPFFSIYYPFYAVHRFVNTKKHKDGSYYYGGMNGNKWKTPHEKAFKGKVYLLINGGSFSAACLMASRLSVLPNVTVVGEETGGDFNGTVAGIMPVLNLPNSNIIWRIGLMHVRPVNRTDVKGRGIFPDQAFTQSVKDIIEDKDNAMNWILAEEHL